MTETLDRGIRDSYDAAAQAYADHLVRELDHKPLDRHLLNRFAEEVGVSGQVLDLGCGPGHVAHYLHQQGADVTGIDLSPRMVAQAQARFPDGTFRVGDMRRVDLPADSVDGIVAFYAIVHLDTAEFGAVFAEMRRLLRPGGHLLLAFHAGDDRLHVEELFGVPVSLDFRFHRPQAVIDALAGADLRVIERIERAPYAGFEYPSERCYLLARRD